MGRHFLLLTEGQLRQYLRVIRSSEHHVGDHEDPVGSGVDPQDDITVYEKPVEVLLFTADGTPLVKKRPVGFRS